LAIAKEAAPRNGYDILASLLTPQKLLAAYFPKTYVVPVYVSGSVAEDMDKTIKAMKLDVPAYEEVLDNNQQIHLNITNQSYTIDTKDLLAGILNPVDMMNSAVMSVLKYKTDPQLASIISGTVCSIAPCITREKPLIAVTLLPKGKQFAYTYNDEGSLVREAWLFYAKFIVDSSVHTVHSLQLCRCTRTFSAAQTLKPAVDTTVLFYQFTYDSSLIPPLPLEMSLTVNEKKLIDIKATYRQEDKYRVFDTRAICYSSSSISHDTTECITLSYGAYGLNKQPKAQEHRVSSTEFAKQMRKAAEIMRKAEQNIKTGSLEDALPLIKKVVADYPQTPQAAEARKLLQGLPGITIP
jgi:hypothetical protein